MTFWDICAPFYDKAERSNTAYDGMLRLIRGLVPQGASVLEIAAGTGSVSLAVSDKANSVLCTDISVNMLKAAREKAAKRGIMNISFARKNLFDTGEPDNAYSVVIASQVLHLIDEPRKAADEVKRVSMGLVITSVALLKGLRGIFIRPTVGIWRVLGFAPKREFDEDSYRAFLCEIGLPPTQYAIINGNMPMAVAVWNKT
ncbi:MAG: class I SAM-dependent methyltransferase [Oscillospiraceae bacterium]|jgi:SAM-dependent methyltransferase|nr:class I SAM-dependent methyltransferase [Oscillospiraceae bacterium]